MEPVALCVLAKQLCAKLDKLATQQTEFEKQVPLLILELINNQSKHEHDAVQGRRPRTGLKERQRQNRKKAKGHSSEHLPVADMSNATYGEDLDNAESSSAKISEEAGEMHVLVDECDDALDHASPGAKNRLAKSRLKDEFESFRARADTAEQRADAAEQRANTAEQRADAAELQNQRLEVLISTYQKGTKVAESRAEVGEAPVASGEHPAEGCHQSVEQQPTQCESECESNMSHQSTYNPSSGSAEVLVGTNHVAFSGPLPALRILQGPPAKAPPVPPFPPPSLPFVKVGVSQAWPPPPPPKNRPRQPSKILACQPANTNLAASAVAVATECKVVELGLATKITPLLPQLLLSFRSLVVEKLDVCICVAVEHEASCAAQCSTSQRTLKLLECGNTEFETQSDTSSISGEDLPLKKTNHTRFGSTDRGGDCWETMDPWKSGGINRGCPPGLTLSNTNCNDVPFKIQLCRHFAVGGCNKGATCSYAHGENKLKVHRLHRRVNDGKHLDKSKSTRLVSRSVGHCTQFASRKPTWVRTDRNPQMKKTIDAYERTGVPLCLFWKRGQCTRGSDCRFSHNPPVLKQSPLFASQFDICVHPKIVSRAYVNFHKFEFYEAFASWPPKIVSRSRVTTEQDHNHRDGWAVAIHFLGHLEDVNVRAIAAEVNLRTQHLS